MAADLPCSTGRDTVKAAAFFLLLAIFTAAVTLFVRYHTLFFYSLNLRPIQSLLAPVPSIILSLMVIAALLFEVIAYGLRFIVNSAWIPLVKNTSILLILWAILSCPLDLRFKDVPGVDLNLYLGSLLVILIVVKAAKFLKDLILVIRGETAS